VVGRRIAKRVYSSSYKGGTVGYLRFVYDGANIAFEADSMGAVGLRFTWGGVDDLLAVDDGTNHYYVVQDLLRSVRGFVRRDGTWVVSHRSDPYGAALARDVNPGVPIPNVRHTWTSREYDAEIGWFYFRSRYYDPSHYRFVQEDPIGHAGGGNLYVYAAGNPLAGRDPSGLLVEESLTTYGIVRGSDDPGGGGGGDPWGQEDDYDRRWDWSHPRGEAHFITFCFSGECTSETRYLQPGAAATCPGPACPSVSQLISNKAFMRQVRTFFDVSQRIGKEVGAYFVADANGSVSVGRSGVGVQGGFDFSTLGPAPRNTFAEFHTHHDEPRGGGVPGGEPNSSDWPSRNDIYSIVMNRSYIWFITPWAPPGQVFKWH
jgi:RHS repeat-associated protein